MRFASIALAITQSLVVILGAVPSGPTRPQVEESVGVWPMLPPPPVIARFDPPEVPWGAGHRGIDLAGRPGQPVRSALAGTVTYAGPLAGRGVVVVDHGDTRTTYEPVSATVSVGQVVTGGGRIGVLGLAGSHCFPRACLHWGWLRGSTYLDPLVLVGVGRVRLLPLEPASPSHLTTPRPVRPAALLTAPPTVRPWAGWHPLAQALGCACR